MAAMGEHGPFETEQQARETAAVRAVYAAFDADPGVGKMRPHNLAMLTAECEAAHVRLGAFDERVLAGFANWEPESCKVAAGVIHRAAEHGAAERASLRAHLDADHAAIRKLCQIAEALDALADTAIGLHGHVNAEAIAALRASRDKIRLAIQEVGAGLNRCSQEGKTDGR
jgi:hypothetical protein